MQIKLTNCVTNSNDDVSVDVYRHSVIPVLKQFGLYDRDDYKFELKIVKRGSAPLGGGEVYLTVPNPKKLRPCVAMGKLNKFKKFNFVYYGYRSGKDPAHPGNSLLHTCLTADTRKNCGSGKVNSKSIFTRCLHIR